MGMLLVMPASQAPFTGENAWPHNTGVTMSARRQSSVRPRCKIRFICLKCTTRQPDASIVQQIQPIFAGVQSPRSSVKVRTVYLERNTRERYETVPLKPRIAEIVRQSGVGDGLSFVSLMHVTATVYGSDIEGALIEDKAV